MNAQSITQEDKIRANGVDSLGEPTVSINREPTALARVVILPSSPIQDEARTQELLIKISALLKQSSALDKKSKSLLRARRRLDKSERLNQYFLGRELYELREERKRSRQRTYVADLAELGISKMFAHRKVKFYLLVREEIVDLLPEKGNVPLPDFPQWPGGIDDLGRPALQKAQAEAELADLEQQALLDSSEKAVDKLLKHVEEAKKRVVEAQKQNKQTVGLVLKDLTEAERKEVKELFQIKPKDYSRLILETLRQAASSEAVAG
jgi:hypothetical protein